ncbi:MAG: TetR family transcriptional regulator [Moraxellaceae bacterium]|nr:MAG: TetR family transcriptional regulator [Moraxellaceae bacterium]
MPYSKDHTQRTRQKILQSAYQLFAAKGFDSVTVNQIMNHCRLTRGAFYGHFKSKADLYNEALQFAVGQTNLSQTKPNETSEKEWLTRLLDDYLSIEHVRGECACPLAFLATDIVTRDRATQKTYSAVFDGMNTAIYNYANRYTRCSKAEVLSLTAMIIGAVAVSRAIKDKQTVLNLLASCRKEAGLKLGGI